MILKKDNRAYISFYNALLHEGYKDLAALLHSGIPVISSSSGKDSGGGITSYGLYLRYPLSHYCHNGFVTAGLSVIDVIFSRKCDQFTERCM
jgi:hypothetical protein